MKLKKLFKQRVKETREWLDVPEWCNPAILKYFADKASTIIYTKTSDNVAGTRSTTGEIKTLLLDSIQARSAAVSINTAAIVSFCNPEDNAYDQFKFKIKLVRQVDEHVPEYEIKYEYTGSLENGTSPLVIQGSLFLEDRFYKILVIKESEWVKEYYTCTELYADIQAWLDAQITTPRFNHLKRVWDEMQSEKDEIAPFVAADAIRRGLI
jgi:hypothetical protein